jgi:hypothetical protein
MILGGFKLIGDLETDLFIMTTRAIAVTAIVGCRIQSRMHEIFATIMPGYCQSGRTEKQRNDH